MATAREVKSLRRRLNEMRTGRDYHRKRTTALASEIRELKDEKAKAYAAGSAETLASVYAALDDLGIDAFVWLGQRLMSARRKKPPFGLPPGIEKNVRAEIVADLRKAGMDRAAIQFAKDHPL